MTTQKTLLIIDAFSLIFRAFYSYPPTLTLQDGTPINAGYGFIAMLFKAIDQFNPDYVCVCFDRKEPTFRSEIYPEYKAHRPPPPDEFKVQIPHILEMVEKLGLPSLDKAGYEADDIIGTVSTVADRQSVRSLIMTGDHDALQLVTDNTHVIMNKKGVSEYVEYTPDKVKEKYQLTTSQIIDYKALKGDASDNIPGVKGVGDKTATTLLQSYNTLDGIYENLDEITSKSVKTKLTTDKEKAYLSYKLATIDTAVPIEVDIDKMKMPSNWETILDVFKEYEFNALLKKYTYKLDASPPEKMDIKKPDGMYQCIESLAILDELIPLLTSGFAIDLETTSLNIHDAQIVGIAIAITEKKGYYIALNEYVEDQNEPDMPLFETEKKVSFTLNPYLERLKLILENPNIPKITHHGKYEINVLNNYNITLKGISFDTLLAAYVLDSMQPLGLKSLVSTHLHTQMTSYDEVAGKGKDAINFKDVPLKDAVKYAAADADYTLRLYHLFKPQIDANFKGLFYDIELPIQDLLAKMECEGVCINTSYLKSLETEFQTIQSHLTDDIYELAGTQFNINSPKQLSEVLFDKMGIPVVKKTKSGASTDASVLEKLAKEHPIAKKVVAYRHYTKLLSTYIEALPKLINPITQKIHTSFNQTVTATGRLSSTHPNLQNIPIRTEEGVKIRKAFTPSHKKGSILSVDYSQIELRILAHMADDKAMKQAFIDNKDIHQSTASLVFHVPYDEVTKDQRSRAKAVNFGITYGQSAFALSDQLGISRPEAKEIIEAYYASFSRIQTFIDDTIQDATKNGYVFTEFGRKRDIPNLTASNKMEQRHAQRIAVNTRVQGTAADIMKIAMLKVQLAMDTAAVKSKILIQVHDELVFDIYPGEEGAMKTLVKEAMEKAASISVPLTVDSEIGSSWMDVS